MNNSGKKGRLFAAIVLLVLVAQQVSAQKPTLWDIYRGMRTVAAALGVLMIAYAGVRWVMADSPQDREDAKKMLVYVMIGLIVVAITFNIVGAVYCGTLRLTSYGAGIC